LVQFDDLLPMAQVAQSRAEMSIAQANHKRNQDLAAQNFISARTVDESAAALEVSQAKLALSQATAARLKIIAPFDGMTGIRTVNPGDYLKDGADIVNIEDIDAVYVDFRLPERFFTKIKKGQRTNVDLDALPGRKFVGIVQAVDPLIDANGRSVGVRACIDNRQMQLRPGMFARVSAVFGERERALVVPEEAIVPQGAKAFILKVVDGPDGTKVSQRVEVKTGIRRPGRVEVTEGLTESDVVIVAGQQRVQKDGTAVRVIDVNKPAGGPGGPGGQGAGGGAPGAAGAAGAVGAVGGAPAAGASAPVGAASAVAPSVAAAPAKPKVAAVTAKPADKPLEGPNPCLVDLSDTTGAGAGAGAGTGAGAGAGPKS
jgi:membrane fusion protein, multidrug efflux system